MTHEPGHGRRESRAPQPRAPGIGAHRSFARRGRANGAGLRRVAAPSLSISSARQTPQGAGRGERAEDGVHGEAAARVGAARSRLRTRDRFLLERSRQPSPHGTTRAKTKAWLNDAVARGRSLSDPASEMGTARAGFRLSGRDRRHARRVMNRGSRRHLARPTCGRRADGGRTNATHLGPPCEPRSRRAVRDPGPAVSHGALGVGLPGVSTRPGHYRVGEPLGPCEALSASTSGGSWSSRGEAASRGPERAARVAPCVRRARFARRDLPRTVGRVGVPSCARPGHQGEPS